MLLERADVAAPASAADHVELHDLARLLRPAASAGGVGLERVLSLARPSIAEDLALCRLPLREPHARPEQVVVPDRVARIRIALLGRIEEEVNGELALLSLDPHVMECVSVHGDTDVGLARPATVRLRPERHG